MAVGKLSPRQKMINMMYLVLTALLALNVSKEVLNSFFEVNKGIVSTTDGLHGKSSSTYSALENFNNKIKSAPYINLTNKIKPRAEDLIVYIQKMKYDLVFAADKGEIYLGFYEEDKDSLNNLSKKIVPFDSLELKEKRLNIAHLNAKDSRSPATKLFDPESNDGRATILKNKISNFRDTLKLILEIAEKKKLILPGSALELKVNIDQTLSIDTANNAYGANKVSWEIYNFYDMPAVAALTLLSKWQADIRNMEADVVGFLASSVGAEDLKFTSATATSIPSSTYVTSGDEFSAKIFLSAFDENQKPEIFIGDYTVSADSTEWRSKSKDPLDIINGKGIYNVKTRGRGPQSYKGFIKIPQENEDKFYPFEGEYTVAPPSAIASPDFMLAMFVDQKNPITVSAAGQDLKNVSISINQGGKVKKANGEWVITPTKTGKLIVTISGINSKKKRIKLGTTEFKVFNVPPPVISINGISNKESIVTASEIINAGLLSAKKEGFITVFEGLSYRVKSFKLSVANLQKGKSIGPSGPITRLDQAKIYLNQANSGDIVSITEIWYSVNGKKTRYKNDIIKKIK